jgi:predicted nucleic acid-binding protein
MPVAKEGAARYLKDAPLLHKRSFIDTNVLIYVDSADEPAKQQAALKLLKHLRLNNLGVLSTQVLTEYTNVALNKLKLDHPHIRLQLNFWQQFESVQVTPSVIEQALDLHQTRQLRYYDALILAAAITSGCAVLYSGDMQSGQSIHGVQILNPFKPNLP